MALSCPTSRGGIRSVDGKIEQSEVPNPTSNLELCPDGPDVLGKWRLRSNDLSLVSMDTLCGGCDDA